MVLLNDGVAIIGREGFLKRWLWERDVHKQGEGYQLK